MPNTLALAPLFSTIPSATPVHPFGQTSTSGLAALLPETPAPNPVQLTPPVNAQVFAVGASEFSSRPQELQSALISRIGALAQRAAVKDDGLYKGGMIIDTPAEWSDRKHSEMVKMAVRAFEVNVLVVLGSEKLMVEMSRLMSTNKTVTVLRAPKSGGVSGLFLLGKQHGSHHRVIRLSTWTVPTASSSPTNKSTRTSTVVQRTPSPVCRRTATASRLNTSRSSAWRCSTKHRTLRCRLVRREPQIQSWKRWTLRNRQRLPISRTPLPVSAKRRTTLVTLRSSLLPCLASFTCALSCLGFSDQADIPVAAPM